MENKERSVAQQYTAWASTYDEDKVKMCERAGYNYKEFMDSLIRCCDLKAGMNILDVGTGTGLTAISLAKALSGNCKILGIEPIDAMKERAKSNIKKESLDQVISIKKASAENIPSEDGAYDLVTCTFAIRHTNIERSLNEFTRILKPKGRIVIADICAPEKWKTTLLGKVISPIIRFMFRFGKYKAETKSRVLTVNEWKTLLKELGLTVIEIIEFPGKKDPEWELKRVIISAKK